MHRARAFPPLELPRRARILFHYYGVALGGGVMAERKRLGLAPIHIPRFMGARISTFGKWLR